MELDFASGMIEGAESVHSYEETEQQSLGSCRLRPRDNWRWAITEKLHGISTEVILHQTDSD